MRTLREEKDMPNLLPSVKAFHPIIQSSLKDNT